MNDARARLPMTDAEIVAHFARRQPIADEVDLFLRDLSQRIEAVRKLLHDKDQTRFALVTIPEAMSVRETERYFELLRQQNVPVRDLIVNRVEQEHDGCEYCHARVQTQQPWLKQIATSFRDPTDPHEPTTALVAIENAHSHSGNQPVSIEDTERLFGRLGKPVPAAPPEQRLSDVLAEVLRLRNALVVLRDGPAAG